MTVAAGAPAKRPIVVWDLVTTIILIVVGGVAVATLAFLGFFLIFASDSCTDMSCNTAKLSAGILVAVASPPALFLVATVVAVVLLVRRRRAFWVPIVGVVVAGLGWGAGYLIVSTSVDGFFGA